MTDATPAAEATAPDTSSSAAATESGDEGKTFTQAELEAKIAERLSRERKKYADYDALKQRAKEYDALAEASMTEQERKLAEAVAKKENEVTLRFAGRLVEESIRAATAGRLDSDQVEALLEGLDHSRFLSEDGDVDKDRLAAWVDKVAPASPAVAVVTPHGLGQGVRGGTPLALNDDGLTEKLARAVGARR